MAHDGGTEGTPVGLNRSILPGSGFESNDGGGRNEGGEKLGTLEGGTKEEGGGGIA